MQHDPVFLLTESETNVAEVFRLLGRTDIVTAAQAAAKKDRTGKESLLKVRVSDEEGARQLLAELDHVPALRKRTDALRKSVMETEVRAAQKTALAGRIRELQAINLQPVPGVPNIPTDTRSGTIAKLRQLTQLEPRTVPDDINLPPPDAKRTEAIAWLQALHKTNEELASLKKQQEELDPAEKEIELRKKELETELGVCPTCERSFADHETA